MPSPPAGVVETGAPSFVVLGPEALGLSSSPIDLHLLPDGRVLVVSQHELAFGDGVRWETFREVDAAPPIYALIAVGDDGQLYSGIDGGFARIDLSIGSRWHFTEVAKLTGAASAKNSTLVSVNTFPNKWIWYGGNGAIVSWRPGETAELVGTSASIDKIFTVGKEIFYSDLSSGGIYRLKPDGSSELLLSVDLLVSASVTCAIPFDPGRLLVGTVSEGLKLFDGKTFTPFPSSGVLNEGHRITDICSVGDGFFAASIDTVGIVFFNLKGRSEQVLDRSLDHRLARVQRLQYAREGVLWALLNDGVARVEFPSAVSHFEPLLASGLAYALPLRHAGELWILADGRAMHAVYSANHRLEGFRDDTPPGHYLFTMIETDGQLFASNDEGIYVYETTGWKMALPGIVNARLSVGRPVQDEIYYVARGEFGTIRRTGEKYTARRIPFPDLIESYNAGVDSTGIGWLELGLNRIGRLDPHGGDPLFQAFGPKDGLSNGWAELYLLDGIARFHVGNQLFRFDDATQKFVTFHDSRFPQLNIAGGRPVTDSSGRLWYTAEGAVQVIDRSAAGGNRNVKIPSIGFSPTGYTAEDDGVMWAFVRRRLARIDLRQAGPPEVPLHALITSVEFPASNRQLFGLGEFLDPLDFSDNSLVFHFEAPANPFASPITFQILLEGAGTQWVTTGSVGSATFNRLKEGDYAFHVRPVAGGVGFGREDRVLFTVRPPWFRSPVAWASYVVASVSILTFVIWLSFYLPQRKNEKLERLVAERTGELKTTNEQLGRQIDETTEKSAALSLSEERFRTLNAKLEDRVARRTAELSKSNEELQQREFLFRLVFEHAPVGITWRRMDLGEIYHFNPTFGRILELSDDALADFALLAALVHPEDSQRHAEMDQLIATGKSDDYTIEERFVLKGGRLVWGLLSFAVIRDEVGHIIQEIGILEDISLRKQAEEELAATHKRLLVTSREAGMAEVATGVLHNVGNVLNSVNVSATLVSDSVRHSKSVNVAKLAALFEQHRHEIAEFITKDPRGKLIPDYLGTLAQSLEIERGALITELEHLRKNVEHIKEIVAMQQAYARTSGVIETISVTDMVEDALRINAGSLQRHDVDTFRDYQERPVVTTDKHKVMQILINLVRNAKYACDESGRTDKQITVRTTSDKLGVKIAIVDNGVGVPAKNLARIFNHGFTTRAKGHGFGLHSGAIAAKELGGSLNVQSDGPGLGATFTLELPYKLEPQANEDSPH
jgi:PAS domain S-box-containing protein